MLTNTFIHIPYVNETTEKELWSNGVHSWDDFLDKNINVRNKDLISRYLVLSKERLEKKDHTFFAGRLLSRYHWRAYPDFKENCCFLDIETTGLSRQDDLTVIGLYNGKESKVFVNGQNLEDFKEEIKKYSYIVTYNGSLFDIPFIKAKFPDIEFDQFHADLRFVLYKLGYSGGLKRIEKKLGIERDTDLQGMDGKDAVRLWKAYKNHDDGAALKKLIRYNIEDIENLKTLMEFSYDKMKEHTMN